MTLANNGHVIIDTVPPSVVSVSRLAGGRRVLVVFRDNLSGLNVPRLLTKTNYTFAGPHGVAFHPTDVKALPKAGLPTDPQRVVLTLPGNRRLLHAITTLRIAAAGVTDNAGNTLQSVFFTAID
jgi:hypothetical protein